MRLAVQGGAIEFAIDATPLDAKKRDPRRIETRILIVESGGQSSIQSQGQSRRGQCAFVSRTTREANRRVQLNQDDQLAAYQVDKQQRVMLSRDGLQNALLSGQFGPLK